MREGAGMADGRIALIAGQGRLPEVLIAAAPEAVVMEMEGFPTGLPGAEKFRFERLVPFMDRLHEIGVTQLCFAGRMHRPKLEPEFFDSRTAQLVPRVAMAMGRGDDGLLREILAIFEEDGFAVLGADALHPDLVPGDGVLTAAQPSAADRKDADRAAAIVAALGALDVGQGAVVAQGQCLAVEALPGTDSMLDFVAQTARRADAKGAKGVFFKAPKPGQDRRVDLPALGPATVARAAAAGLAGIVFEAGGVLMIDRAEMVAEADRRGLFLWGRAA